VSADRAFALLRSEASKVSGVATKTRLTITDVRLGKDTFETDRESQPMPAWLFTVSGVDGPVAVLAVAQEAQWFPSGLVPGRGGKQVLGRGIYGRHPQCSVRRLARGF